MAKRAKTRRIYVTKARSRKKNGFTIPLAAIGGFVPLIVDAGKPLIKGDIEAAGRSIVALTTGYDYITGSWSAGYLKKGLLPIAAGLLIHKFVGGKLGVNAMLGRAGVPFIRI